MLTISDDASSKNYVWQRNVPVLWSGNILSSAKTDIAAWYKVYYYIWLTQILNKAIKKKVLATEMDYWRRAALILISRLERIQKRRNKKQIDHFKKFAAKDGGNETQMGRPQRKIGGWKHV